MRNTPVWKNQNHKHWQVICFVNNQVAFKDCLLNVCLLMCPTFDTLGIISDWRKVQQAPYHSEFMLKCASGHWFVVAPGYDDKLCPWLSLWLGNTRLYKGQTEMGLLRNLKIHTSNHHILPLLLLGTSCSWRVCRIISTSLHWSVKTLQTTDRSSTTAHSLHPSLVLTSLLTGVSPRTSWGLLQTLLS